jgi:hypothetical protein
MLGLDQRHIGDNINIFQKNLLDPVTGETNNLASDVETGDYLDFYAEIPLIISVSLCPNGSGAIPIEDWNTTEVTVAPLGVEVYDGELR